MYKRQLQKFTEQFLGPSFLVVAFDEVVAPAKVLTKFATDNEKFALKGGWFEGSFLAEAGIEELSKLPSREETLAKLLNLLTAPATQLLRVTNAPGTNVVQLLAACRDKLEKEQG